MNPQQLQFAQRREALKLQCAAQRLQLLDSMAGVSRELQAVDRVLGFVRNFRLSPGMLAGAASMLLGLGGGGRTARVMGRGWLLFNTLKKVWDMVQVARAGRPRRSSARHPTTPPVVSTPRE